LQGLKIYEPGREEPFLEAGRVSADLNAVSYLLGRRMPNRVKIDDAHLRLRFDAAGKLLTHFEVKPAEEGGEWPSVRLRDSRLTILQEGRPPFTLEGVSLEWRPGQEHKLTGQIDDTAWGPLQVTGTIDPKTSAASLELVHKG